MSSWTPSGSYMNYPKVRMSNYVHVKVAASCGFKFRNYLRDLFCVYVASYKTVPSLDSLIFYIIIFLNISTAIQ